MPLALVKLSRAEVSRREGIRKLLMEKDSTWKFELAEPEDAREMQGWLRAALKETLEKLHEQTTVSLNTSAEALNWALDKHIWTKHCKCKYPFPPYHTDALLIPSSMQSATRPTLGRTSSREITSRTSLRWNGSSTPWTFRIIFSSERRTDRTSTTQATWTSTPPCPLP